MSEPTFEELMTINLPPEVGADCAARSYLRRESYTKRRPDGLCIVCRGELPPRRIRYCSDACGRWFAENHDWTTARHTAWTRNFEVNHMEIEVKFTWHNFATNEDETEVRHRVVACCSRCHEPDRSHQYGEFHSRLEVDHIIPINGGVRAKTCMNHQDNLRVVCHRCHVELTKEQRKAGLIGKNG